MFHLMYHPASWIPVIFDHNFRKGPKHNYNQVEGNMMNKSIYSNKSSFSFLIYIDFHGIFYFRFY